MCKINVAFPCGFSVLRLGLTMSETKAPGTKVQRRSRFNKSASLTSKKHLMVIEIELNLLEAVRSGHAVLPAASAGLAVAFR